MKLCKNLTKLYWHFNCPNKTYLLPQNCDSNSFIIGWLDKGLELFVYLRCETKFPKNLFHF